MSFGRKRNETGNQFEGLLGQGERLNHEVSMADLMVDMNMSVKKHSKGAGEIRNKKETTFDQFLEK